MKIISYQFNYRMDKPFISDGGSDWILLLLRSPAAFAKQRLAKTYPENTAIICSSSSECFCRSAGSGYLSCDVIFFRITSTEQQWLSGLNIPIGQPFSLRDINVLRNLMRCIQSGSASPGKYSADFNSYALQMMLIDISHQLNDAKKPLSSELPYYSQLQQLRTKIRKDPASDWNIDSICRSMNISKNYLHRIYLAAFGVTCIQDVIDARLSLAKELLVNSDDSVSHIAELCGYESDSYFMRQFKQHTGFTPSKFRKSFSQNQK